MTLKDIFKRTFAIISSPTTSWEMLAAETGDTKKEDNRYFYTLLIANIAASFISSLFYGNDFDIVAAILRSIILGISVYAGFWGIYYILVEFLYKRFQITIEKDKSVKLIIYSLSLSLSLNILTAILPGLFFLKIINVYTLYIVWEGVSNMLPLDENERSNFALILSATIILLPFIINQLLLLGIPAAQ